MVAQVFDLTNYTYNFYAVPTFLTASAILFLGLVVLISERRSKVSVLFFLATLTLSVWLFAFSGMYSTTDEGVALWWAKGAYLGIASIPSAIYHFAVVVLRIYKRRQIFVWTSWLLSIVFTVLIIGTNGLFSSFYHYWWGYYPNYEWLSIPFLIYFFAMMIVSLREYWTEYRGAEQGPHKLRAKWFLIAFSIAYIGSVDYIAKFGFALYPFGYLPMLIFLILAAWTIKRYQLVNINPSFAANQIIETMRDLLILYDADGKIQFVNPATHSTLCYTKQELDYEPIECLADVSSGNITHLCQIAQSDQTVQDKEMVLRTKSGQQVDVSVSSSHLKDRDGFIVGTVVIAHDIRERKLAEEEKELFVYSVSHDLMSPLTFIKGTLKEEGIDIPLLQKEVDRAIQLVKQISEWNKIGFETHERNTSNLSNILNDINLVIQSESEVKKIDVHIECPVDAYIFVNENQIQRVFDNLLGNAVKFSPSGSKVQILVEESNGCFEVQICDSGPGIPPEKVEQIFKPYYSRSIGSGKSGLGLGLAIVKKIIEYHNGTVKAIPDSKGRIVVTIPKNESNEL